MLDKDKVTSAEDFSEYGQFCSNGRSGILVRPSVIENPVKEIARNQKTLPAHPNLYIHTGR